MKKIVVLLATVLMMMSGATVFNSCEKQGNDDDKRGLGKVSLQLKSSGHFQIVQSAEKSVQAADVDVSNPESFKVEFIRKDGWTKVFNHYSEMPEVLALRAGEYTVRAISPKSEPAAFEQPIYLGETQFKLVAGDVRPINIECTLSNMKVTPILSENFKKELTKYTITITNAKTLDADDSANHTLVWTQEQCEQGVAGYFTVAPLLVKVDAYRIGDTVTPVSLQKKITNVNAMDWHKINIDAQLTGEAGITIKVDSSVKEKEEDVFVPGWNENPVEGGTNDGSDIDDGFGGETGGGDSGEGSGGETGGETGEDSNLPTLKWEANPNFERMPITAEMDVNVSIEAEEKIKTFVVAVDSKELAPVIAQLAGETDYNYENDGAYEMDLINAQTLIAALDNMNLGLPTGKALQNQVAVEFPLSKLIPMIAMYNPESGSEHIFTLKVSDQKDQSLEQALTFYIK